MPTQILDDITPSFPSDDRIFLGEGLFETLKIEQQCPLYAKLHWQRMGEAALVLNISFDIPYTRWREQLDHCIQEANISTGGIKVILSGGMAPRGLTLEAEVSSLVFNAFTYQPSTEALHLINAPWLRDAENPIYRVKSINYLESILARRHAESCKADDALFFNVQDCIMETTVANIFIIKQDKLFTPRLDDGVLPGIIRNRLVNLAKNNGISCTETSIDRKTFLQADAVFVTNVLQGVRVVKSYKHMGFNTDHPLIDLLRMKLASDSVRWD